MTNLRSDDLLVLLSVSRHRTFAAAGRELGVDHTTVARRLDSLARALGGPVLVDAGGSGWRLTPLGEEACAAASGIEDALGALATGGRTERTMSGLVRIAAPETFMAEVVAPAVALVSREHRRIQFELVSVTRPTPTQGPSVDLEIGVTRGRSRRLVSRRLMGYKLGLFASAAFLEEAGPISTAGDLAGHPQVYYVESMIQVSDLDLLERFFPGRSTLIGATSVAAQVSLVKSGAGIGLLPVYLAERDPELHPVLNDLAVTKMTYWLTGRPQNLRRPEVELVADAITLRAATIGT